MQENTSTKVVIDFVDCPKYFQKFVLEHTTFAIESLTFFKDTVQGNEVFSYALTKNLSTK